MALQQWVLVPDDVVALVTGDQEVEIRIAVHVDGANVVCTLALTDQLPIEVTASLSVHSN